MVISNSDDTLKVVEKNSKMVAILVDEKNHQQ